MDERDLALRNLVYRRFVQLGRAPGRAELGDNDGLRRLDAEHALVLDEASGEIRMANPFSAVPGSRGTRTVPGTRSGSRRRWARTGT